MWYSLVLGEKIAEDGEKAGVGDDDDVIMILFWNMKQLFFEDDGDFSLEPCLQRERERCRLLSWFGVGGGSIRVGLFFGRKKDIMYLLLHIVLLRAHSDEGRKRKG